MAIQFKCPACQQPIEVDDKHGGGEVSCPYCHNVVAAPAASTFDIGSESAGEVAPEARRLPPRPSDAGPVPPPPGQAPPTVDLSVGDQRPPWPVSQLPPTAPAPGAARQNVPGIAGMICGVLALGMLVPFAALSVGHHEDLGMALDRQVDQAEMQKRTSELMDNLGEHSWFVAMIACMAAAAFFWLTGLILSVAGMSKRYRNRIPAIVGLIVAMVLPFLVCSGLSLQ